MVMNNESNTIPDLLTEAIESITSVLEDGLPRYKVRLTRFMKEFNTVFPKDQALESRVRAEALTWALMNVPLFLYAVGLNGASITELHSILERLTIRELAEHLSSARKKETINRIIERYTLLDLVQILAEMELIEKEQVKYVKKLSKLRNGIAHKNPHVISNTLLSGKKISFLDIDATISKVECIPLLIEGIRYLVRLSKNTKKSNTA
jgi:hypothetical protein